MYCGLDFRDPDGLLHLSLLPVARRYHLVCSLDESQSREIDVRAVNVSPSHILHSDKRFEWGYRNLLQRDRFRDIDDRGWKRKKGRVRQNQFE